MKLGIKEIQRLETNILIEIDRICRQNGICYYLGYGSLLGAIRHNGPIPWDSDCDIVVKWEDYNKLCNILKKQLNKNFHVFDVGEKKYAGLFYRVGYKGLSHKTIHVDVFPIIGAPSTIFKQKLFVFILRLISRLYYCKVNPINYPNGKLKRVVLAIAKVVLFWLPSNFLREINDKLFNLFPIKSDGYIVNGCGGYGFKEVIPTEFYESSVEKCYEGKMYFVPKEYDKVLEHFYGNYMIFPPKDIIEKEMNRDFVVDESIKEFL